MKESTLDAKRLRQVAGCFPTGVTVVSVHTPDGSVHGMTASSFLSVSLTPPLVLFSVMNENQLNSYLEVGANLGISILNENMEGESNHFAKIALLEEAPVFVDRNEAPVLEEAHAWYATTVEQLIPAGDHVLVLCRVEALDANLADNPLVYYQGYKNIK